MDSTLLTTLSVKICGENRCREERGRDAIAQNESDPPNALVTNKPVTRRRMPSLMFPACHTKFMALLGHSRPRQCTANLLFLLLGGAQRARHASWRTWLCKPVRYEFLSPLLLQDDLVEISSWSSPLARCNF